MSKLSLLIVATLATVADGVKTASFNAVALDSTGGSHSGSVDASTLVPNADGSATLTTTLTFADDIPAGSVSGTVSTIDTTGAVIGSPVSYSGTIVAPPPAPNQQPVVTSVTVQV